MVCKVLVEEMGLKDLHVAATSLGSAQDIFADYMERGIIVEAQTSGVRGRIGEVISAGKLKNPAIIRSHGGRPRAVEAGEVHIDIAFLAAATSDCCGNAKGTGGKNNCGSMGFANHDARFADHAVVITDTLAPFPNLPSSISCIDVAAVCGGRSWRSQEDRHQGSPYDHRPPGADDGRECCWKGNQYGQSTHCR